MGIINNTYVQQAAYVQQVSSALYHEMCGRNTSAQL